MSPFCKVKMSPLKGPQNGQITDNEQPRNHTTGSNAKAEGQTVIAERSRPTVRDQPPAGKTALASLLQGRSTGISKRTAGQTEQSPFGCWYNAAGVGSIKERYEDFGPTLAHEKLVEVHGLQLSRESVRQIMIEEDIWKPKRVAKGHRPARCVNVGLVLGNWCKSTDRTMIGLKAVGREVPCWCLLTMPPDSFWNYGLCRTKAFSDIALRQNIILSVTASQWLSTVINMAYFGSTRSKRSVWAAV